MLNIIKLLLWLRWLFVALFFLRGVLLIVLLGFWECTQLWVYFSAQAMVIAAVLLAMRHQWSLVPLLYLFGEEISTFAASSLSYSHVALPGLLLIVVSFGGGLAFCILDWVNPATYPDTPREPARGERRSVHSVWRSYQTLLLIVDCLALIVMVRAGYWQAAAFAAVFMTSGLLGLYGYTRGKDIGQVWVWGLYILTTACALMVAVSYMFSQMSCGESVGGKKLDDVGILVGLFMHLPMLVAIRAYMFHFRRTGG